MTWPTVRAQVAFDTDPLETPTWTTIHEGTSTQRATAVQVRTGRSFELDPFQPGTMTLRLDNSDRRFDPLHATGPYFGKLLPRKRCRLQADWGAYLNLTGASGSVASTPDVAALDITGDIDLRARVALDDWTPSAASAVLSKANTSGQFSWSLAVNAAGTLVLGWSTTGALGTLILTNSTTAPTVTNGDTLWIRATLDVDDGGGNRVVKFYTSTDDTHDHAAVTWTQLGSTVTTAGTTSIFSGSAVATLGALADDTSRMAGKVYAAAVLSGIGGTVVANPDFTDGNRFTGGGSSGTDGAGLTWTVASPASLVAVTYDLYSGFVDTWPQEYGRFQAASQMTATDGFKILSKIDVAGAYEEVVRGDGPVGWWRLGDDTPTSDLCADSSGYGHDGRYRGSPASVDPLVPGTADGAVDFDGTNDRVELDLAGGLTSGPLSVECWVAFSDALAYPLYLQQATDGTLCLDVEISGSGQIAGVFIDSTGAASSPQSPSAYNDGEPHHVVFTVDTDKKGRLYVDGELVDDSTATTNLTVKSFDKVMLGSFSPASIAPLYKRYEGVLDEVAIYDVALTADQVAAHYEAGATLWSGDTTGARIDRVLDLAGWPAADRDIDTGRSTMDAYATGNSNILAVAQQAEATEGGALWQAPNGKITFRDRHAPIQDWNTTTSQAAFTDDGTATDPQHYTVLGLTYDDSLIVNEAAVTWIGGTETSRDQDSVDAYARSVVQIDTGLTTAPEARDRGDWLVYRYKNPAVRPDRVVLRPSGDQRLWRHCLARKIGDRVTVRRLPQNTGTAIELDATIESIAHRVTDGRNTWETEFGLSPTAVDLGWLILDDTAEGLLDTGRLAY